MFGAESIGIGSEGFVQSSTAGFRELQTLTRGQSKR